MTDQSVVIFDKLANLICRDFEKDRDYIYPQTGIYSDLGLDSLDSASLILAIDEEFGIDDLEFEVSSRTTVGDLVVAIEEQIKKKGGIN